MCRLLVNLAEFGDSRPYFRGIGPKTAFYLFLKKISFNTTQSSTPGCRHAPWGRVLV